MFMSCVHFSKILTFENMYKIRLNVNEVEKKTQVGHYKPKLASRISNSARYKRRYCNPLARIRELLFTLKKKTILH